MPTHASQRSNNNPPSMHANPYLKTVANIANNLPDALLNCQGTAHSTNLIVLVRLGKAKINDNAIAHYIC